MNKLYWQVTLILLITFFFFFWKLDTSKPQGVPIKLTVSLTPSIIRVDANKNEGNIIIKLKAENKGKDRYTSEDYFYRIIFSRSPYPYSPGFVVKEFTKNLEAQSSFEEEINWKREYLIGEKGKPRVHFNLYQRNGVKEPILLASASAILFLSVND